MGEAKLTRSRADTGDLTQPDAGTARRYRVEHRTTYSYSADVTSSYGRCYLTPRDLPHQRCVWNTLDISPVPSDQSVGDDVYGNRSSYFHVTTPHTTLEVTARTEIEVDPLPMPAAANAPWEQARPEPRGMSPADHTALAVEFVLDLWPAEITSDVTKYAAKSLMPGRALREAIAELTERIYTDFTYQSGSTTVSTSVAEVFAAREGVCQDFARVAVACLRSHGLAARYVSGYLATDPPPGRQRVVGADATHAWAAVWVPGNDWLAFDPTNNQFVNERYVTAAWGRDYADCPPLRGIIYTDARESTITVSVDVETLQ